jgi:hypothetical protein
MGAGGWGASSLRERHTTHLPRRHAKVVVGLQQDLRGGSGRRTPVGWLQEGQVVEELCGGNGPRPSHRAGAPTCVRSCVSSEVMIASGSGFEAFDLACRARMNSQ